MKSESIRNTTILGVRVGKKIALGGDGQVTMGDMQMKSKAVKVRSFCDGKILAGFAGAVADAMALFEKFEAKLTEVNGNLQKAVVVRSTASSVAANTPCVMSHYENYVLIYYELILFVMYAQEH